MKKTIHILSILAVVLILAQLVCMFLPYWNLTPIADRVNKDPRPTDFSIQDYCWSQTRVMQKIFEKQFKADYNAKYNGNDYIIGLVLVFVTGVLSVALILWNLVSTLIKRPSKIAAVLSHVAAFAWAFYALWNFFTNFILTLGVYPMVLTVSIAVSVPAAVIIALRFVFEIIVVVRDYRAEYCA